MRNQRSGLASWWSKLKFKHPSTLGLPEHSCRRRSASAARDLTRALLSTYVSIHCATQMRLLLTWSRLDHRRLPSVHRLSWSMPQSKCCRTRWRETSWSCATCTASASQILSTSRRLRRDGRMIKLQLPHRNSWRSVFSTRWRQHGRSSRRSQGQRI